MEKSYVVRGLGAGVIMRFAGVVLESALIVNDVLLMRSCRVNDTPEIAVVPMTAFATSATTKQALHCALL